MTANEDRGVEGLLERAIAVQVRRHRRARGLTVGELAVRAGISKAMLSKIENSLTSSSLTTLSRLAAALDVPVTALFRGADGDPEAVFTPAARGTRVGHEYALIDGPHTPMEARLVTLTERGEAFPLFRHAGTELLFML